MEFLLACYNIKQGATGYKPRKSQLLIVQNVPSSKADAMSPKMKKISTNF